MTTRCILLVLGVAFSASAATLRVPEDYPQIWQAIGKAADGDTILVGPGAYDGGFSFVGKNLVVMSSHGPAVTEINTFYENTGVYITSGQDSTAVLEGFTICYYNDSPEVDEPCEWVYGGGVQIVDSSPVIRGNVIDGLVASYGGGIYIRNGEPRIEGNTINACRAGEFGDAMYVKDCPSTVHIVGNLICNTPNSLPSGIVYIDDVHRAWITGNVIRDNEEAPGLHAGSQCDSIWVVGNVFTGNDVEDEPGTVAIYWVDYAEVYGNIICGNSAHNIAGLYTCGDVSYIVNNVITNNTSGHACGGLTIGSADTTYVFNTIIRSNTNSSSYGPDISCWGAYLEIQYSNISYGQDSIWLDYGSVLEWGPGNIDLDPLFETGPFGDYHLSAASPCIDAGNPASEYNDPEDPFRPGYALWPALGLVRNDMGAYGGSGVGYWLSAEEEASPPPATALQLRASPNPFSYWCAFSYVLPEPGHVELGVYDLSGRLVETLESGTQGEGQQHAFLRGVGLPCGTYLVRLEAGGLRESVRCVLVR